MPEDVTLDDLHNDDDIPVVDGEDKAPLDGEEDLETGDGKDPAEEPADGKDDGDDGAGDDPELDIPDPKKLDSEQEIVDGVESFLSEFNIIGGMINIEDDEGNPVEKHFADLTEPEKLNVLKSLSEKRAADIESKYDLQESEIDVLNAARNSKVDIKEYIEKLAQDRVSQLSALGESNSDNVDYKGMSDDAIFVKFLKESEPDVSEDDIANELTNAKNGKLFSSTVDRLRDNFIQEQETVIENKKAEEAKVRQEELESERSTIVNAVVDMDKVADWDITPDDKNTVLEKILEVNDYGDPVFMEEIFSDPKVLFKAAWLFYNAEDKMKTLETYYKKEVGSAYRKGFDSATEGNPSKPISGTGTSSTKKPTYTKPGVQEASDFLTLDDLDD